MGGPSAHVPNLNDGYGNIASKIGPAVAQKQVILLFIADV